MKRLLLATLLLAATACSGSGTTAPTPPGTLPGTPDVNSLTKLVLPAGDSHCPTGGVALTLNNGSVEYVCNGAVGPQGPTGPQGPAGSAGGSSGSDPAKRAGSRLSIVSPTLKAHTGSDGSSYPEYVYSSYGDFYDNQLQIACRIDFASDRTSRCLPISGGGLATELVGSAYQDSWYFTDSSCTNHPWSVYSGTQCGVVGRFAARSTEDTTVCPSRRLQTIYSYQPFSGTIYEIVTTVSGSDANGCPIYKKTCTPVAVPVTTCGGTSSAPGPFVIVTEVPPSTFVLFNP